MKIRGGRWMTTVVVAALFAVVAVGCGSSSPASDPAPVAIGAKADGTKVSLSPGQELVVTLEGNPTTGFSWALADLDKAVLSPVGEPQYTAASTGSTLVGGGGVYVFRLKAVAAGETQLKLAYARSWEKGVAPEKTFSAEVSVK